MFWSNPHVQDQLHYPNSLFKGLVPYTVFLHSGSTREFETRDGMCNYCWLLQVVRKDRILPQLLSLANPFFSPMPGYVSSVFHCWEGVGSIKCPEGSFCTGLCGPGDLMIALYVFLSGRCPGGLNSETVHWNTTVAVQKVPTPPFWVRCDRHVPQADLSSWQSWPASVFLKRCLGGSVG